MLGSQKKTYKKAIKLLEATTEYVTKKEYDIQDKDCVRMFDLNNRLEVYIHEIYIGNAVVKSIIMLDIIIFSEPFIEKTLNSLRLKK